MRNVPLWLVLVLGLIVGVPAGRLAVAPPGSAEKPAPASRAPAATPAATSATTSAATPAGEAFTCKGTVAAPPPSWCEPIRLLGDFLGRPPREKGERGKLAADVVEAARQQGYDLRFLVALVPAPPDPRLDQALEAIQRGFAQSEYLADRVWLPWTSEGANRIGGAAQVAPGLLLFRRTDADGSRSLALVFLVGETPRAGIQKAAFREALELAADLQGAAGDPTVALLGPSFSGSVESLRLSLLAWKEWEGEQQRRPSLSFVAATGSATAAGKDVEEPLANLGVRLCRTVLPDETLHELTLGFLRDEMGWNEHQIALLVEADTAYGRGVLEREESEQTAQTAQTAAKRAETPRQPYERSPHAPLVMVPFPSHISELRTATEKEKAAQAKAQAGAQPAPRSDSTVLELDLTDPGQPADLVPTFTSDLTLPTNELVLENLLRGLSREGIRYVGILATDVKDKLFLAEQVRSRVPDAVLFTFDNGLLYAHPQYAQTMDGMLVFSSAPLLDEGSPWQPASLSPVAGRMRRQLGSELQQGTYEAVRYLLTGQAVRPRAWVMAVGNGSLWPVARLPVTLPDEPVHLCGDKPPDAGLVDRHPGEGNGFAGKDDLQILLVAVLLVAFAWRLWRAALLEQVEGDRLKREAGTRALLLAGTVLLALAAGLLLAVGSVPWWARRLSLELRTVSWQWVQIAYLGALALVYVLLAGIAARAAHARLTRKLAAAWVLGGAVALVAIAGILRWLCMPGGQSDLFHLRARALSSGLSPLVSLAVLGFAVYLWLLWELKRRRLMARQATDCPVETLGDPAVFGSGPALGVIHDLLAHTWPRDRRLWLLPAVAFLPPLSLLWATVQPVAETKGYGRLFLLFLVLALALAALSYFRFFRLWVWTLRVLQRLDNASPRVAEAFEAVAKDLDWRPIQSFGWQIPPFKTLTLSARRLKSLAAAGKVKLPEGTPPLDDLMKEVFRHETDAGSPQEIAARNRLEEVFAAVCRGLDGHAGDPEVRQLVALRVAAWLRYVFAHMRSCLIGALASGVLALVAVTAYAFQPRHFVSLAIGIALAASVGLTLLVFVQMDRNATLSRIGATTPGKVTFDRTFFAKLFTFVGLPVLGLVATQFPEVGRLLGGLAGQFLRIAGGG